MGAPSEFDGEATFNEGITVHGDADINGDVSDLHWTEVENSPHDFSVDEQVEFNRDWDKIRIEWVNGSESTNSLDASINDDDSEGQYDGRLRDGELEEGMDDFRLAYSLWQLSDYLLLDAQGRGVLITNHSATTREIPGWVSNVYHDTVDTFEISETVDDLSARIYGLDFD